MQFSVEVECFAGNHEQRVGLAVGFSSTCVSDKSSGAKGHECVEVFSVLVSDVVSVEQFSACGNVHEAADSNHVDKAVSVSGCCGCMKNLGLVLVKAIACFCVSLGCLPSFKANRFLAEIDERHERTQFKNGHLKNSFCKGMGVALA